MIKTTECDLCLIGRDITPAGGPSPSMSAIARPMIKTTECDLCLIGRDITPAGGPSPSMSAIARPMIKTTECDLCLIGRDITPLEVTSPIGRTFTIPKCFSGVLDERTGIPLSACRNCVRWVA
jgi:hypothetical protein